MLETGAREVRPERAVDFGGIPIGGAHELPEVGCKAGRTFQTAMHDPRMPAVLRQVLPCHDDRPETGVPGDVMVEVLARKGFIVHDEAALAKPEILHEDCVAGEGGIPRIMYLDLPEPEISGRVEPKSDAVAEAVRLALPDGAVAIAPDTASGFRPDNLKDGRIGFSRPKTDAPHSRGDGGAENLVDHDPGSPGHMLDCEEPAILKQADLHAGLVPHTGEPKIGLPWGMKFHRPAIAQRPGSSFERTRSAAPQHRCFPKIHTLLGVDPRRGPYTGS
jgi:hypothetical protein